MGRDIKLSRKSPEVGRGSSERCVIELNGVGADGDRGSPALHDVSLQLRKGEILGIAGVAGNGQRELAEVIAGLRRPTGGSLRIRGRDYTSYTPQEAIGLGIGYVPDDRLGTGLAPDVTVAENLALKAYSREPFSWGPFLKHDHISAHARALMEQYDVTGGTHESAVRSLSGGNIQKLLLAREIDGRPAVLVAVSPTRGLDIAATQSVRTLVVELAASGTAILLISEDLDEILTLSDRVAVLYEGRIVGTGGSVGRRGRRTRPDDGGSLRVRFTRRLHTPWWLPITIPIGSVIAAFLVGAAVLLVAGHNPADTYIRLFERGFLSENALSSTLRSATPLVFTGLAAAAAFRMRLWNIGGEGQLFMGAIGASGIGLALGDAPAIVVIPAMILSGALFGALWALVPGVLRARFNTNEIITSLMLNYVCGPGPLPTWSWAVCLRGVTSPPARPSLWVRGSLIRPPGLSF